MENETLNYSYLLFRLGDGLFFASPKVLKTLCQRAGSNLGAAGLRSEMNIRFHRDAGYVAYMGLKPESCGILFRKQGKTKKMFAVFSERYKVIPQDLVYNYVLAAFKKKMGTVSLHHYEIDNFETEICPVSYTHLRAHETGRNLVCRLLLEKKKKKKQKTK